ncbi:glutathione S-transferase theta-1-like isoform X1 [Clavelina lepadiformis]|uniref:glutathione S-transferase theta-1-like isoform X1 n=1 Tax=Clavelina lepadiformis TaxID=159417 RepID=UPI0040426A0C
MSIKLYIDMLSQPCRALVIFMKTCKVPFEAVQVAIRKGENRKEPFLKLNPLGKLPVMMDGQFVLTESVAIFRYICRKFSVPENIYPSSLEGQAKVDEYLEWQHMNTRYKAATVFIGELFGRGNVDMDKAVSDMNQMMDDLEMMFLKNQEFINGDQVSFADILAACEIVQPMFSGRKVFDDRPRIKSWFERVRRETQPHFDEAHSIFYQGRERFLRKNKL